MFFLALGLPLQPKAINSIDSAEHRHSATGLIDKMNSWYFHIMFHYSHLLAWDQILLSHLPAFTLPVATPLPSPSQMDFPWYKLGQLYVTQDKQSLLSQPWPCSYFQLAYCSSSGHGSIGVFTNPLNHKVKSH